MEQHPMAWNRRICIVKINTKKVEYEFSAIIIKTQNNVAQQCKTS